MNIRYVCPEPVLVNTLWFRWTRLCFCRDYINISTFDFFDSYLPAYEIAFKQGNASGAMCSYNGENGHPSCTNGWILNGILREKW